MWPTNTDVLGHRLEIAKQMGATHVVNVSGLDAKTAAARIHDVLGDEPDSTMECSGAEISTQMGMYVSTTSLKSLVAYRYLNL